MKTKKEILNRLCEIDIEITDIHIANKVSTVDMDRNRRRNLSEEWVILHRLLDKLES